MTSFLILIICVNLDALSFGVAYGLNKKKINLSQVWFITILSTIFFTISLLLSIKFLGIFNQFLCNLICGIILIIYGIIMFFPKEKHTAQELNFSRLCTECFIISLDAVITAFFNGFYLKTVYFYIFFYLFMNFFAIFCGNRLCLKISKVSEKKLSILSGLLFILLGTLKIFGV